jgi:hypothetical protein
MISYSFREGGHYTIKGHCDVSVIDYDKKTVGYDRMNDVFKMCEKLSKPRRHYHWPKNKLNHAWAFRSHNRVAVDD